MTAERPDIAELLREHRAAVVRLARSLVGPTLAEDLAQETCLRAIRRYDTFTPGTNAKAWLLRIATNVCFDERRRQRRTGITASLDVEPPGRTVEPGGTLEAAEAATRVRTAMMRLSELTRLVFHLRATEDLSFREIAELAGTTEQAARWHMRHARVKLMELLGDEL